MKKLFILLTLVVLALFLFAPSAMAFEGGSGTAQDPYLISTPAQLDDIRDDLSAHYRLNENIDMIGFSGFEPIGDETVGAFSGSFDGNGHTISNLSLPTGSGKYVGLFGYSEGTIRDLTLANVFITGGRFVGGVAGYNATGGEISGCTVTSGTISASSAIISVQAGGITAGNRGLVSECSNGADITATATANNVPAYAGGLLGRSYVAASFTDCTNSGAVSASGSSAVAGGMAGYAAGSVDCTGCTNSGDVSSSSTSNSYAGGMAGYAAGDIDCTDCTNSGDVSGTSSSSTASSSYAGGMAGYAAGSVDCTGCSNSGNISAITYESQRGIVYSCSGGLVGSSSAVTITSCTNSGDIRSSASTSSMNSNYSYSGGIVGRCEGIALVTFCTNSGKVPGYNYHNVGNFSTSASYSRGIMGYSKGNSSIKFCYDVTNSNPTNGGQQCLYLNINLNGSVALSELTDAAVSAGWDFAEDWVWDARFNSGLPTPRGLTVRLQLSEAVLILAPGDARTLRAYFDGEATDAVAYSTSDEQIATVGADGEIEALANGTCQITALMADGTRANCWVYVITPTSYVSFGADSYELTLNRTLTLNPLESGSNETVHWSSSNTNVASVSNGVVTGNRAGTAVITATAYPSGKTGSCTINVLAPITGLSLPATAAINIGTPYTMNPTITPSPYTDTLTWESSDTSCVLVENGVLSGVSLGTAVVTVRSASGRYASCTVTVKQPSSEITLNKTETTIEVGLTEQLYATLLPNDTADVISWSSSVTNCVSVSSSGLLTAKAVGTSVITATATSGIKTSCAVKVIAKQILPTSVTVSSPLERLAVGEKKQLTATVTPSNTTNKTISWTSSNENVVSVSSSGVIEAIAAGEAVITAATHNGLFSECRVKVSVTSSAVFVLERDRARAGDIVEIPVYILRNPGIAAFTLGINCDEAVLIPEAVIPGELLALGTMSTNIEDAERDELRVTWSSPSDLNENGLAFTLRFRVATDALAGTKAVSLSYSADDICNDEPANVGFSVEAGSVEIISYLLGDIYADGEINMKDIVLFARHFNQLATLHEAQLLSADLYWDEAVDVKDLVYLEMLLTEQLVAENGDEGAKALSPTPLKALRSLAPAKNETQPFIISVENVVCNDSGEAVVAVNAANCPGLSAFKFALDFDADNLEIVSIEPGAAIKTGSFQHNLNNQTGEDIAITWYNASNQMLDGELLLIGVRTKDGAAIGEHPISVNCEQNNICDENLANVAYAVIKGSVEIPGCAPTLADGVSATAAAEISLGQSYTLDLSSIFTDSDGDALSYTVAVNSASAIGASANYSYTPMQAGTTTLVFTASDGAANSPSYTVTLTANVPADTTAPILSAVGFARTSSTKGVVRFTSNEAATYKYAVVTKDANMPNQFVQGTLIAPLSTVALNVTAFGAANDVYIIAADAAGNESLPLKISLNRFSDCGGDGKINASDLLVVLANYGMTDRVMKSGDLNGDGKCDSFDLLIILANYEK